MSVILILQEKVLFEERVKIHFAAYREKASGLGEDCLKKVTKGLGTSIYKQDTETVSI